MSLKHNLEDVLPKNEKFKILYVQSEPKQCNPIIKHHILHSVTAKPQLTVKIKHFLLIIHNDLIVFGIEIYNYFMIGDGSLDNPHTLYLFVSKVDTTGLGSVKINVNQVIKVFLQYLFKLRYKTLKYRLKAAQTSTIKKINKVLNMKPNYATAELSGYFKIKLSLFTKSSNQYFFPNSSENPNKHVIDGDRLLKWWIKLVNDATESEFSKKLLIPGAITPKIYLLPGWEIGSVFGENQLCIYNLPNFPDDPKTRFLEFLVIENRAKTNIKDFYNELGFRQEFRLGDVVGIIGCELKPTQQDSTMIPETGDIVLTNRQYKRLIKLIKSEDYTITEDIQNVVTKTLPYLLGMFTQFAYIDLVGSYEYQKVEKVNVIKVNNLNGLIRKKKSTN